MWLFSTRTVEISGTDVYLNVSRRSPINSYPQCALFSTCKNWLELGLLTSNIYICIIYTPNLRSRVSFSDREREQGKGEHEGPSLRHIESPRCYFPHVIQRCPSACLFPHTLCHLRSFNKINVIISECSKIQRTVTSSFPFILTAFIEESLLLLIKSCSLFARLQV